MIRIFIAVELPPPIQTWVHQRQTLLQAHLDDLQLSDCIHWTPVAKVHLTLRFLGDTNEVQHAHMVDSLPAIGPGQTPFSLSLQGLGCFPNWRTPSVVWVGLAGDVAALHHLQAQTEQIAQSAGFAPEHRVFSPHITVGKVRHTASQADLHKVGQALKAFQSTLRNTDQPHQSDPFTVDQIVYIQSELRPEGARYTPLLYSGFL